MVNLMLTKAICSYSLTYTQYKRMKTTTSIFIFFFFTISFSFSQGTWIQKNDFPGQARGYSASFSIGSKGYIACGWKDSASSSLGVFLKDVWEYDPVGDNWVQKSNFPGVPRAEANGFSINGIGYVCFGEDSVLNYKRDLWAYNPILDSWTPKATFPGNSRYASDAFVIGSKAYMGFGWDSTGWPRDFWQYDALVDQWNQLPDAPFTGRQAPSLFSINNKGYAVCGWDSISGTLTELWQFDTLSQNWTQMSDFPGISRYCASRFVIDSIAYVGNGQEVSTLLFDDFYSYSPSGNTWQSISPFPGLPRGVTSDFSINAKGYVCMGFDGPNNVPFGDIYEYTPSSVGIGEALLTEDFSFNYDQSTDVISVEMKFQKSAEIFIMDMQGKILVNKKIYGNYKQQLSSFATGMYLFKIETQNNLFTKKIVIH